MKKIILAIFTLFLATSHTPILHAMESQIKSNDIAMDLLHKCIQFCRDHKEIVAVGSLTLYVWTKYITAPWQKVTIPGRIIPAQHIPRKEVDQKEMYLFGGKITLTYG